MSSYQQVGKLVVDGRELLVVAEIPSEDVAAAAPAAAPAEEQRSKTGRKKRKDAGKKRGPRKAAAAPEVTDADFAEPQAETPQAETPQADNDKPQRPRPNNGRFIKRPVSECSGCATLVNGEGKRYVVVIQKHGVSKKGPWAIALYPTKDHNSAYHKHGGFWIDDLGTLEVPDGKGGWASAPNGKMLPVAMLPKLCKFVYG